MTVAVEGPTDAHVAARLVAHTGGQVGRVLGRQGKAYVGTRIGGYCQAARRDPWLVLLADADALAAYMGVRRERVPEMPDRLADPKDAMVALARRSRDRRIRRDMVPLTGGGGRTGLRYAARMTDYVQCAWRPEVAAQRSESLRRAIACLEKIVEVRRREMS